MTTVHHFNPLSQARFARLLPGVSYDLKHPSTLTTAILTLLLALSLLNTARSAVQWWQADALATVPAPLGLNAVHPSQVVDKQASLLPRLHLFGVAMAEPGHAMPVINPTQLPLHLIGVYQMVGPNAHSEAVLALSGQAARTIREGGTIMPGVSLSKVYADHVLLSHEGQLESLSMAREF